jgi:DNA-binding GntR family transcriptional regulator
VATVPPSAQIVYETTKEQILSGDLPGGTLLSENGVARRLHVSRTPAREAFVRLESEGLLTLQARRGAVVVPVPLGEAVDVLEVRQALEVAAVQRLVRRRDRSDLLDPAAAELAHQAAHTAATDLAAFAMSDHRFHRAIVDAAGNAVASRLYATLGDRHRRMTAHAVGTDLDRLVDLLEDHRGLLERATTGDADGFAALLRTHLEATHRVMLGGR